MRGWVLPQLYAPSYWLLPLGGCMAEPVVILDDVSAAYGRSIAIHNVHAAFEAGSLTAVAGPNGSGKSTFLKVIAGILKPSEGKLVVAPGYEKHIAYLAQTSSIKRDFPMPVLQAVCSGFMRAAGEGRAIGPDLRAKARQALHDVGLEGFEDRQIGALSGGQFQRVLFARTIVEDAKIILLDEPFAAVDGDTTAKLIQIILKWHEEGRTVICVLHDLLLIRKYFPESVVLSGKCIGRGHTHDLFRQKLLSYDLDMAELHPHEDHHVHAHSHGPDCKHEGSHS